jgi:penicillin-binding protein 2
MNEFEGRKFVVLITFLLVGIIFIIRLFSMQVATDKWKIKAAQISEDEIVIRPSRGLVYDRNGDLLVANIPVYDIMVTPKDVKDIDTMAFCELVGISKEAFIRKIEKAKKYASYKASIFEKQIPLEQYHKMLDKLGEYRGFASVKRTLRGYPRRIGAHVLGYISEVNPKQMEKDHFYRLGDYVGSSGIERYYERHLRGQPGVKYVLRDKFGNVKEPLEEGRYDTTAIPGKNLYTTLDADLQAYGEHLMKNKMGSIVAIEPSTGEILCLVSSPTFDPNLLVGRIRSENYSALIQNDSLNPLFNRALMAAYPPGSIFKIVQSLIGLEDGVLQLNTGFPCNKALVGCHNHASCQSVIAAIQNSCNPYYYRAVQRILNQGKSRSIFKDTEIGLGKWRQQVMMFGMGQDLAIDLPNIKSGNIPSVEYYDKIYGRGRWAYSTIYSISIGQGEMEVIPLQMANLAAIIANGGHYYTPHIVQRVGENGDKLPEYRVRHSSGISAEHFPPVREAMRRVVYEAGGTARRARLDSIIVCGKTGTAQNPHGEDHSVFIAFAPMDKPTIAIAVYVENAGGGGTWAAPISSLMIDQYISDSISKPKREQRILDANFIDPPK